MNYVITARWTDAKGNQWFTVAFQGRKSTHCIPAR